MKPTWIDYNAKKGNMIVHECEKCEKKMKNKVLEDDDLEAYLGIQQI